MDKDSGSWITKILILIGASAIVTISTTTNEISNQQFVLNIIIGVIIFILILFKDSVDHLFYILRRKVKNLPSGFIYDELYTRLDFLDIKGKRVIFYRDNTLSNINLWRNKRSHKFEVFTERGHISKTKTYSAKSSYSFASKKLVQFQIYFDKNTITKGKHYSAFSTEFKSAFQRKSDRHWIFVGKEYCKKFVLEVVLPSKISQLDCEVFERTSSFKKNNQTPIDTEWIESDSSYTIQRTSLNYIIRVTINGIDKNMSYKVCWNFE